MIGRNRVVITGLGVLAANGIGKDAFWKALLAGESGIRKITLFDASNMSCQIGGEVPGFDPKNFFSPQQKARRMGRFTQLALVAFEEAVKDAQLEMDDLRAVEGLPIMMGVSTTAMDLRAMPATSYSAVTGIPNAASSTIAYTHGLNAQIQTISNGCASSLDAITHAFNQISTGKSDIAIAGGSDSTITEYVYQCMCKSRKVSTRNDDPANACRPFDLNRAGGVIAEGSGIIVLESLEQAIERAAPIYSEVLSFGRSIDPAGSAEGSGLEDSMRLALQNAGKSENAVDFISAHGPGDQYMDVTESDAIKNVFGKKAYDIPITSIKGSCGNAMGTGGVQQLIATALTIRNGEIPPTTNYTCPDPDCDLDYVPQTSRIRKIKTALVNSHGFGRSNCSIAMGEIE
ncbi:beta-ketoacyl-[acyl-carrier-protein] synthase family protein [Pontiellaceae bacterium B12227]|nr:beta-ketoacyl-[acyl-carrier-protein] synthase family protein [Pontiellaceae bacterium B12227]